MNAFSLLSFMNRIPRAARLPRVKFVKTVQVRFVGNGKTQLRRCTVSDLSRGGMFIRTPEPLAPGTRVSVALEVRGQALPFAEVEVAWHRARREAVKGGSFPGFGVKFTELAPRARALVDHLVFLCAEPKSPPAGPAREYLVPPGLKPRRRLH